MKKLLKNDVGVLCATAVFGKTVVSDKIISEINTNTLIIVNRNNLLEQLESVAKLDSLVIMFKHYLTF